MPSNSTVLVSATVTWCAPFCLGRVLTNWQGLSALEPALTSANLTKQLMLAAPLAWPFNRGTATAALDATHTDYVVSIPDFGFLEKCVLVDGAGKATEISISPVLGADSLKARPSEVSVQTDTNDGNITFRFISMPEQIYTATFTYQKAAALMTALTGTWAPIPDKYAYIYERLFLAHMYATFDYSKYLNEFQVGLTQLAAANAGLDEVARNQFLEQRLRMARQTGKG